MTKSYIIEKRSLYVKRFSKKIKKRMNYLDPFRIYT
jgi:hypothetical protein